MLKVILGKLSLITLAASFAVGFGGTEVMAKGCKKECMAGGGTAAECKAKCKGEHKDHKGKHHKKHEAEEAKQG